MEIPFKIKHVQRIEGREKKNTQQHNTSENQDRHIEDPKNFISLTWMERMSVSEGEPGERAVLREQAS